MKKEKMLKTVKGRQGQHLNQREANLICDGVVEGVLRFTSQVKKKNVVLSYDLGGLVTLDDFLHMNGMGKRLFVVLLRNIVLVLKGIEEHRFSKSLLMWSLQSIYVEPSSWHVYMMYVPLQPFETTGSLTTLLLEFISLCNFEPNENIEYVQQLVREVNSVTSYTVGMLESYCDKVSKELLSDKMKNDCQDICSTCGFKLTAEEAICPFCGKQILAQARTYLRDDPKRNSADFWTTKEECKKRTNESKLSRGTISINEDENGVVTVFRGTQRIVQSVWLEDCMHVGKIYISKFPFRIGKMEGVTDYQICNNAVSRKHADILKEQSKYYIVDLGSTNGTYLNGKRIQPGVKEVLSEGMFVKFANSEFKIHID